MMGARTNELRRARAAVVSGLLALVLPAGLSAQDPAPPSEELVTDPFANASGDVFARLKASIEELRATQDAIAAEKVPLNQELSRLEAELRAARAERDEVLGQVQASALQVANLDTEIKNLEATTGYLGNQLSAYIREFEAQLHVVELERYREQIESVKSAPENGNLSASDIYAMQSGMLATSIDRALDLVGGTIFTGQAVDPEGAVKHGAFALIGPTAIFRDDEQTIAGTAEQRLGSLHPRVIPFPRQADVDHANGLVATAKGRMPLDPSLGNAHKVESTKETLGEHLEKGGVVVWPIGVMAALAWLAALWKWGALTFLRGPSKREVRSLIAAIEEGDEDAVVRKGRTMHGPIGRMLRRGTEHVREPKELVEEVMYENILQSRLSLQSLLPFIAICAAAAPLLGLLGTVIGIIETFKQITIYGSGDVKMLSSGISTALITTELGLIVAIPSLLLHAYLSRKARAIVGRMETTALAFVNAVGRSPFAKRHRATETAADPTLIPRPEVATAVDPELVRRQVSEILGEILGPLAEQGGNGNRKSAITVG